MAKQLTSLSMALSCTTTEAQWQADADMLAAVAQLSELRHLDVGNCLFVPTDGAQPFAPKISSWAYCRSSGTKFVACFTTNNIYIYIISYATCVPAVLHAGRTACTQLSTLRKLTSLTAGQRPTQHLQALLPALRVLKCLRCHVPSLHADGSGALPVLSELKALTELHITSKIAGDYSLGFPLSLQVHKHTCICMLVACTGLHLHVECSSEGLEMPGFPITAA
jgi:hypothetical protein